MDRSESNATVLTGRHERSFMSTVRPAEVDERLQSGDDPFLLDIRPTASYQRAAIAGSYNLPVYGDLRGGNDDALRNQLAEIPQDRDVVVVCKMGIVAKRATHILREEGYDAATLLGGMSGWSGYQNGSLSYKLRSLLWKLR